MMQRIYSCCIERVASSSVLKIVISMHYVLWYDAYVVLWVACNSSCNSEFLLRCFGFRRAKSKQIFMNIVEFAIRAVESKWTTLDF